MTRRHSQRGASVVETAVVLGVLLALLLGLMGFGRALYTYAFVAQMAREGARWAIVRGSQSCANSQNALNDCDASAAEIQSYVQSLSEGPMAVGSIGVPVASNCTNAVNGAWNAPGCVISVTVTYPFAFALPFLPAGVSMSSTSQMVISQ